MSLPAPFNLMQWIEDNKDLLKPPVLNQTLWKNTDFIVMIVGGPNVRTDYHDDPYEEFFYQIKGEIVLELVHEGKRHPVPIREGDVYLIAPHTRHRPQRPQEGSYGLVVERTRPAGVFDAFEWYCERCVTLLHRREVHVSNIVEDLPPVFNEYYGTPALQVCKTCGFHNPTKGAGLEEARRHIAAVG